MSMRSRQFSMLQINSAVAFIASEFEARSGAKMTDKYVCFGPKFICTPWQERFFHGGAEVCLATTPSKLRFVPKLFTFLQFIESCVLDIKLPSRTCRSNKRDSKGYIIKNIKYMNAYNYKCIILDTSSPHIFFLIQVESARLSAWQK